MNGTEPPEQDLSRESEEKDLLPRFRAVKSGDTRRGIRLEQVYWDALTTISQAKGVSLSAYIADIAARYPEAVNITSVLRVMATRWLRDENMALKAILDTTKVDELVQVCPSPCFALQENKRIVSYNPAFLNYVHGRVLHVSPAHVVKRLRLSMDVPVTDLVAELRRTRKPVRTGYVLGIDDQRLRGNLAAALAPVTGTATILGYIL